MDIIVNWFILILVSVFDPLAVSLVIAANHLRQKEQQNNSLLDNDNSSTLSNEDELVEDNPPQKEIKLSVENQITDAVTFPRKQKNKKEKKYLAVTQENVILDEATSKVEEHFYDEFPRINSYRRGRKKLT
jgi:hypothetical protein